MSSRWGSTLVAACMGVFALIHAPAMAQVEWVTSLRGAAAPIEFWQNRVVGASDGSIYVVGSASDGEAQRGRLVRLSASGAVQWVRWVGAQAGSVWAHPDNSVSVLARGTDNTSCVENFSLTGNNRSRWCFQSDVLDSRFAQTPDGDLVFAQAPSRMIKKISPLGVERWSRQDSWHSTATMMASGIDSAGNYYEVRDFRLRTWSGVDGTKLTDVAIAGQGFSSFMALPRASRDLVMIRGTAITANALATTITRNNASGSVLWTLALVFPRNNANDDGLSIVAADGDATYVIHSSQGDSQVAKVSASGTVLWQKHYARARRIIETANGLVAVRSDVNVGASTSDSFLFPINMADGTLAAPTIYSRSDIFVPTDWFAVPGGVIAAFRGINPVAPFTTYPVSVSSTTVFVGTSVPSSRWIVIAEVPPPTSLLQGDCLMPRLALSNPSGWWARTAVSTQVSPARWFAADANTGSLTTVTAQAAKGCGSPITADGGRVIISEGSTDRVRKVDANGSAVWQTPSAVTPSQSSLQPLQHIGANGDITYVAGSVVGRVSAGGTIQFETETNLPPIWIDVDIGGNTWKADAYGSVSRLSSTGTLLWSSFANDLGCSSPTNGINGWNKSALLLASDELLVTTRCGDGTRVFKFNGAGQLVWQRDTSGTSALAYVQLNSLQVDSTGNIYAGGCGSLNTSASAGSNGMSVLRSWTASGTERWLAQADLIASAHECVSFIVVDSDDNVYAASSSNDANRVPVLWSLTASGVERWRHAGVLSEPIAGATELRFDAAGKLIALGETARSNSAPPEVSVRRIDVTTIGSPLRLKFLEVPAGLIPFREQFPVRIGLRTIADAAANAITNIVVTIGIQSGAGTLDGSRSCTIVIGASECIIVDVRYDAIGTGVTLSAGADGFIAAVSPPVEFVPTVTTTTFSALTPGPYTAFSIIRVRVAVQAPPRPDWAITVGNVSGPYSPLNSFLPNCTGGSLPGLLIIRDCDFLMRTSGMPITAGFTSGNSGYLSSAPAPASFAFSKVTPTLQITNDPANTYVGGDRVRFRVAVFEPGGLNVSSFVAVNEVTVSGGGTCFRKVALGSLNTGYSGSYVLCEVAQTTTGMLTVNFSFTGNADLLPTTGSAAQTVAINPGGVVRSTTTSFPAGINVCTTTPGVTCGFSEGTTTWQCVGPAGMSGEVFFVPAANTGPFYFSTAPVRYSNVIGLVPYTDYVPQGYSTLACALDVDGDGARMAMTDGILILRRMLNLSSSALTAGATHACVPRNAGAIAQAINLPAYDIDGDGETRAETDGLLLLRAMLGIRGDALIAGATGINATRRTAAEIGNFFDNACELWFN